VEAQETIAADPTRSPFERRTADALAGAASNAVSGIANAVGPAGTALMHAQLSAVTNHPVALGHAAASLATEASANVNSQGDPNEITLANVAAAAVVTLKAASIAKRLGPPEDAVVIDASVLRALAASPGGQSVVEYLERLSGPEQGGPLAPSNPAPGAAALPRTERGDPSASLHSAMHELGRVTQLAGSAAEHTLAKRAAAAAAQFVQNMTNMAMEPARNPSEKSAAHALAKAGAEAIEAIANALEPASEAFTREKLLRFSTLLPEFVKQTAKVVVDASMNVLEHHDSKEITAANVAAAALMIKTTSSIAKALRPSDGPAIDKAVHQGLSSTPGGQAVSRYLAMLAAMPPAAPRNPAPEARRAAP
jgi:hypothetical protein